MALAYICDITYITLEWFAGGFACRISHALPNSAVSAAPLSGVRKFWRCVENGEPPILFGIEPPKPRIEAVRIVDMSSSNAWAELAAIYSRTRSAHLEHEQVKAELKSLVPDDAQQAIGHGLRAKRSKSGAISFDLLVIEASHATN
jgi:hypothetical protein